MPGCTVTYIMYNAHLAVELGEAVAALLEPAAVDGVSAHGLAVQHVSRLQRRHLVVETREPVALEHA